jgi:hypothetical protein
VRDIVGLLSLTGARRSAVCRRKSPIQALDRTVRLLPLRPSQVERRTHEYTRHDTTTLFARLNARTSKVITAFHRRHRSVEFRQFLDTIDAHVPPGLNVHIIIDN